MKRLPKRNKPIIPEIANIINAMNGTPNTNLAKNNEGKKLFFLFNIRQIYD
jgi:hypothetical protein